MSGSLSHISRPYVVLSHVCKHCFSSQTLHHTDHTAAVPKLKYESRSVLKRKQLPDQKEKVKVFCTCQVLVGGEEILGDPFHWSSGTQLFEKTNKMKLESQDSNFHLTQCPSISLILYCLFLTKGLEIMD